MRKTGKEPWQIHDGVYSHKMENNAVKGLFINLRVYCAAWNFKILYMHGGKIKSMKAVLTKMIVLPVGYKEAKRHIP